MPPPAVATAKPLIPMETPPPPPPSTPAPPSTYPPSTTGNTGRSTENAPPPPAPDGGFHEADSGEFSNFFNDVRTAWDRFGTPIVAALLIVSLLWFGYRFIQNQSERSRQLAWGDLNSITSADSLEMIGQSVSNPAVQSVAYLRAGDLLMAEAATAAPADAEAIYASAARQYQAALDAAEHPIYRINARDGLGVAAESQRNFDEARRHYEAMREAAGEAFPYWRALADRRIAMLEQVKDPVVFAPEPAGQSERPQSPPLVDPLNSGSGAAPPAGGDPAAELTTDLSLPVESPPSPQATPDTEQDTAGGPAPATPEATTNEPAAPAAGE